MKIPTDNNKPSPINQHKRMAMGETVVPKAPAQPKRK